MTNASLVDWLYQLPDWSGMLVPQTSPIEIIVRGTVMYLALFTLLRVVLRRQAAAMGVTDLLVVVLIADAAQNAMADDYRSLPDGILLVGVIVFWSYVLDQLGFLFPAVERFVHPAPLALIRDGRLLRRNMAHELVTYEELMTQLREQGITRVEDVRIAQMEGDGRISVVPREGGGEAPQGTRPPVIT